MRARGSPRNLWAPWRSEYVRGPKGGGCVFCRAWAEVPDPDGLVVYRGRHVFAILNRYPYNVGHLMVTPARHAASPEELGEEEAAELWQTMVRCKAALDAEYHPDGYNVGLNLGKAAGAGIAEHLHLHVVPRWVGDTNFMSAVGDARVISQHLRAVHAALVSRLESGENPEPGQSRRPSGS